MSADLESRLALEDDLPEVVETLSRHGGEVIQDEVNPLLFRLKLRAEADGEVFYARVEWFSYPHQEPSVRFVSGAGADHGAATDWPLCPGYRPGSDDICRSFTREGFVAHPDWRGGPEDWRSDGNKFLDVAMEVQNDLNFEYQGRNPNS